MNALLSYFLQAGICSGMLYGYYHFFLRNKRLHQYNRFYLLGTVLLSLLLPLLNIPVYFTDADKESSVVLNTLIDLSPASFSPVTTDVPIITDRAAGTDLFTLLQYGYFFIVILAFLRVIVSLYRIWQLYRQHPAEKLERIRFIRTLAPGTPFSFFRWLFWDDRIELHSAKGNQVFRHELFHIRQQHSIDIVCMEIITALGWLNPFFHLIKKELKAIHEFLADRFAVTENTKWEYAELLLMQAFNTRNSLVNPFFHNQIKRRIAMITNSKKPGYQYIRKLMALPVAATGILGATMKIALTEPSFFSQQARAIRGEYNEQTLETMREVYYSEETSSEDLMRFAGLFQGESRRALMDLTLLAMRLARHRPKLPVLVLGGQSDAVFPPDLLGFTAARWHADVAVIPRAGHTLMLDAHWLAAAERMAEWLDRLV